MTKDTTQPKNNALGRYLKMLKKLWLKFIRQPLKQKIITSMVLLVATVIALVFFSGLIIWKIFCFIMVKGLLSCLEWYLDTTTPDTH